MENVLKGQVGRFEFMALVQEVMSLKQDLIAEKARIVPLRRKAPGQEAAGGGGYDGPFRVGVGPTTKTLSISAGTVWPHMGDAYEFVGAEALGTSWPDALHLEGNQVVFTCGPASFLAIDIRPFDAVVNKQMGPVDVVVATFDVDSVTLEPMNISQKQYGDVHIGMVDLISAGSARQGLHMNAAANNLEMNWTIFP
jgi:hypothetical protein